MDSTRETQPGTTRGSRQAIATRDTVLDAAERLFTEKGFRATSLQEIAEGAGRTTGSIYSSFSGKDDLFLEVFRRRIGRQESVWRETLTRMAGQGGEAAAIGTALRLAIPDPAWHAVQFEFLSFAARDPHLSAETALLYRRAAEILTGILAETVTSPAIPVDRLAAILISLGRGLAQTWFVDPDGADTSLISDAAALLLGAPPSPSPR